MTSIEIQEERDNRNKHLVNEALKKRCKHGMVFEYCATCNKITYLKKIQFPITVKDDITGEDKRIWLKREVEKVRYRTWR